MLITSYQNYSYLKYLHGRNVEEKRPGTTKAKSEK